MFGSGNREVPFLDTETKGGRTDLGRKDSNFSSLILRWDGQRRSLRFRREVLCRDKTCGSSWQWMETGASEGVSGQQKS